MLIWQDTANYAGIPGKNPNEVDDDQSEAIQSLEDEQEKNSEVNLKIFNIFSFKKSS